jgi:hypothetical protein
MLLNILGYMCCIVPGIVIKIVIIKKMRRFQNIVVAVTPMTKGTEVTVTHPDHAKKLAGRFLAALPESTTP